MYNAAVLRATSKFLADVGQLCTPAGYEPLDQSTRLAAGRARLLRHRRSGDSQAIADSTGIGGRWYMDWTRMSECSFDGNKFGLIFAEAKIWPLHARFFPDKSAHSPVEGTEWLRTFVRRTTSTDLLEIYGDSDNPWAVFGRGHCLNIASSTTTSTRWNRQFASSGARQVPKA